MSGVFYHSALLLLLYDIEVMWQKNNKTRFFYVLYSNKTWILDQSERTESRICIIKI